MLVAALQTFRAFVVPVLYSSKSNQNSPSAGFAGAVADTIAFDGGITASYKSLFVTSSYVAFIFGLSP